MSNRTYLGRLLATTVIAGLAVANPAYAQDATNQPAATDQSDEVGDTPADSTTDAVAPPADADAPNNPEGNEIVVTGTLIPRRTASETASPVTVLTSDALEERGITTTAEALQRIPSNGSGTLGEGWNTGFGFTPGAIAPALRGLTVQDTLSIVNGLRIAPYPLADDGSRNFVDISTIPDVVVDRIEVLRDGASSLYGADAIAGVVNVITKKEINGILGSVSAGVSSRGDGEEYRADLAAGYGDLDRQGFNVYVAGQYRKSNEIWARDRGFPFNTGNYSEICNDAGACIRNPTRWSQFNVNSNGTLGGTTVPLDPIVAPFDPVTHARVGVYQLLNGCTSEGTVPVVLPATAAGTTYNPNQCYADYKDLFGLVRPETQRFGFAARATVNLGERHQAYLEGNYMNVQTKNVIYPASMLGATPAPGVPVNGVVLPVYVCPTGTGSFDPLTGLNTSVGCDETNGVLNPDNPFAEDGLEALVRVKYDRPYRTKIESQALRGVFGISGSIGADDRWHYDVSGTASEVRLDRLTQGAPIPGRLATLIANGSYSFSNREATTEANRDYLAPDNINKSVSSLWQVTGTIGGNLFELPGGPLAAAVGVQYRHEAIDAPSANPENIANPYERQWVINPVGVVGSRNVKSAYFEVNAPVLDILELNGSGRYDKYSSGQKNFSPKLGFKLSPVREAALRGTWSKGFRIPSFNQAFGLPSTGYVTLSINCAEFQAFCDSHGNNQYVQNQYPLGLTQVGNPDLKPEKSRSYTLGAIVEPIRGISFTVDYYNIKVDDLVGIQVGDERDAAIAAYLNTGNTNFIPGVTIVPAAPDPEFPNARPLPAFFVTSYINAGSIKVSGVDFGMNINRKLSFARYTSALEVSFLHKFTQTTPGGDVLRYDGTLSPCDISSCSGAPKWRGSWQNTFDFGRFALTGTAYYSGGYDLASVDYGGIKGDCEASIGASVITYTDGTPVRCKIKPQWNFDLSGSFNLTDNITLRGTVLNLFDIKARFDPSAAYSIYNYNPAFSQPNIIGRYFRIGADFKFLNRAPEAPYVAPPVLPPPPPAPPATVTCPDGLVILAGQQCPAPPPPPPPPPPAPERGN